MRCPNEVLNPELDSLIRDFVSDEEVVPPSDKHSFFADSYLFYECTANQIIRWLNLLTIAHQYPSLLTDVSKHQTTYYPLQRFFTRNISLSKKYNYDTLAKDGDELDNCIELTASVYSGFAALTSLLNGMNEDPMFHDKEIKMSLQRANSSTNPCVPFISLFSSFFVTFTGKGHRVFSLPNDLQGFTSFAKQVEDVLHSLQKEYNRKRASHNSKKPCVENDGKRFYEEALRLHVLFSQKVEQWNKAEAAEKDALRLEVEMLKTLLVEKVAEASHSVTKVTNNQFDVKSVCGVMHDAFSQLALYLHYAVPPSVEGLTLLDRYFLTAMSGVRLYYTFAIQQACLVILMNSQYHECSTRYGLLPRRSPPVFRLRASSRRAFAPLRPVDATGRDDRSASPEPVRAVRQDDSQPPYEPRRTFAFLACP